MINGSENSNAQVLYGTLCEKNFTTEVSEDFTLPDYQSEIRRILHVFPTVLPPAKYVGNGNAEFSGTVDYLVMYIGADGGVYSAPLSSSYNFSLPFEGGGNAFACCSVNAEAVNTRVSAPRRLSIRTRLRPNVRIYGEVECALDIGEEINPATVYTQNKRCVSCAPMTATSDVINISYIAPLPSEDTRVIAAEAKPIISECRAMTGTLMCSGELTLKLLCVKEESGEYSTIEGVVPFDGEIDIESCTEDSFFCARGCVSQMSVEVTDAGIECNVGVILDGMSLCTRESEYIDDVYSTERQCSCDMRTVSVRDVAFCDSANFTLSERIPLSDTTLSDDCQILYCFGTAVLDKCTTAANKHSFTGNAAFTLLYSKNSEITATDVSVPIKYECAANGKTAVSFDACAQVLNCKLKIADGNLCIDAEIALSADVLCECTVCFADKAVFGDYTETGEGELIVCYPTADDTTWSVAKRYSVSPSAVMGNPASDKYVIIE